MDTPKEKIHWKWALREKLNKVKANKEGSYEEVEDFVAGLFWPFK